MRTIVALFFGFVFFGAIQHYFQLNFWLTIFLAAFGAPFLAMGATFDFVKKWSDACKAPLELRKLSREVLAAERTENSRIQTPTTAELKKYAASDIERILDKRFRKDGQVRLATKTFVEDSHEERF